MSKYEHKRKLDDATGILPTFFEEKNEGTYSPRAIMVDCDSSVLDDVRCGTHILYDTEKLISGKEDATTFARGYYTFGPEFLDQTMEQLRKVANKCENLQGIFIFRSLCGGTGSGLGSLIVEKIAEEFHHTPQFEYGIFPAFKTFSFPAILEPYNAALACTKSMDSMSCSFLMDNYALDSICKKKLAIDTPNHIETNRLIAEVVSSTTSLFRFHDTLKINLPDFEVNLFPFPKAHYAVVGLSPVLRQNKIFHEHTSVNSLTLEAFDKCNQTIECNLGGGVYMACCLLYRGSISPKDVNTSLELIKNKQNVTFIDCCPTGFKVGINPTPMAVPSHWEMTSPSRSLCLISNNTAISNAWKKLNNKFNRMFAKKAFLHWYLSDGMEEQQFLDAKTRIESLTTDYMDLEKSSNQNLVPPR